MHLQSTNPMPKGLMILACVAGLALVIAITIETLPILGNWIDTKFRAAILQATRNMPRVY